MFQISGGDQPASWVGGVDPRYTWIKWISLLNDVRSVSELWSRLHPGGGRFRRQFTIHHAVEISFLDA